MEATMPQVDLNFFLWDAKENGGEREEGSTHGISNIYLLYWICNIYYIYTYFGYISTPNYNLNKTYQLTLV